MSSIFDLKTNVSELSSVNGGMARMSYDQQPPTRDTTGSNFPNGAIHFRWQTSGQKWWIPNRSYMRLRCALTRGDGTPLRLSDNIAPNMGLCASLFQSAEFRINDKTVSRISDFMPQVDALDTRLSKSRSWLNGVGNAVNFWEDTFSIRQQEVCYDGANNVITQSSVERLNLGFDAATNTVAVAADTGVITFAANAGAALPTLADIFQVGDELEIDCAGVIGTVRYRISALLAGGLTLQANNLQTIAFPAAGVAFRRIRRVLQDNEARKQGGLELIWTPPLSLFKVGHAMPSGKYELILNPQTASVYQKAAIESFGADKTAGTTAATFKFSVVDMYMYVNTVEGPRCDDLTYLLDLEQTRCQSDKIDNNSFGQKNFDVSPSSYALTVAYQDLRAGTNTQVSASKFKSYSAALDGEADTKLNRFYLSYAGQNLPSPDADPSFGLSSLAINGSDYTVQRYVESQIYSKAFYDVGGPESVKEYRNRGAYYHFAIPRDGTDRSTRVNVHQGFDPLNPASAADTTANMRILLFDHSKQVARVRVQDGRVVDVQLEDA